MCYLFFHQTFKNELISVSYWGNPDIMSFQVRKALDLIPDIPLTGCIK